MAVKHSAAEEAAFLESLLSDDSFWNAVPSPDVPRVMPSNKENSSPLKHKPRLPQTPKRKTPKKVTSVAHDFDMDEFLQGADDWDMDAPIELSPVKSKQKLPPAHSWQREPCTRCTIEEISPGDDSRGFHKKLVVRLSKSDERRTVILRDDWHYANIYEGDIVNVIGRFINSTITVDSKSNLLILHPDLLLTPSTLAAAPMCSRKPLLGALIRSASGASDSAPMVWGNMLHEVMEQCLQSGQWNERHLDERIEDVVRKGLLDLVKLGIPTIEAGIREVKSRAGGLMRFASKYLVDTPKDDAVLSNTRSGTHSTSLLAISSLVEVEEDIWSPTYGLKGKLDATVNTTILTSLSSPAELTSPQKDVGVKPFEIKTGRPNLSSEHRAQTMLYTLLLSERYNTPVESGLLYYTQSEEVILVPKGRNEIRGLITGRNEVASFMVRRFQSVESSDDDSNSEKPFLPPPIDNERACARCYVADSCMLYRKAVETYPPPLAAQSTVLADLYERRTSHLTLSQAEFFKKWERLLSYEEAELVRFRKELWTLKAEEREKKGRCFANMVLNLTRATSTPDPPKSKIHQHTYGFLRSLDSRTQGDSSLLNGHLNVGDPVVISVEPDLLALARGFITELTPFEVIVGVDKPLAESTIRSRLPRELLSSARVTFRIDKDELFTGMAKIRDNLAQLFFPHGDTKRLELVVDLRKPVFGPAEELPGSLSSVVQHLDTAQKDALQQVLSAEDYSLILGMPGTGKTTLIAALIRCLVELGKSVLLTSYTHSAVDNVLLKFVEEDLHFGVLRLGNADKIHTQVRQFSLAARKDASSVEQLEAQLMAPPLVATTCLSLDHALFTRREFDVCIVDEASQITLPTCLGPLRYAKTFVLVGDHYQLPPLVRNSTARRAGLDISLFRRLSEAHPNAVVDLAFQYRMNQDIMTLSNKLIYSDRLKCGSEEVAHRSLHVPQRAKFLQDVLHSGHSTCRFDSCWLSALSSPECKAVFVDTDSLPALESRIGDLVQNEVEAELVSQLTETLLAMGVDESQIGIISLYRQQLKLLAHRLRERQNVEILTADRSQGRDKDCIIISLVRSNEDAQVGDLVKDWRRMNVSFTRARTKLVIFGSRKTLQGEPLLKDFFALMEDRGWILKLPPRAHQLHAAHFQIQKKRLADDRESEALRESLNVDLQTPRKKVKAIPSKHGKGTAEAILKGRPILSDALREP